MSRTISEVARACYLNSHAHGFYEGNRNRNFGEVLALIHSELSEALEEYRNGRLYREIYSNKNVGGEIQYPSYDLATDDEGNVYKPEGIPIELADAIIRIFDFCAAVGIDIEKAIELKMAYNISRPYKHGKLI